MTKRRGERGELKAQILLSFAFFALLAFLGWKFIPVYIAAYDFDTAMQTQAQYAGSFKPDAVIMTELLTKATELELPITRENIEIHRDSSRLTITADYTVPVKTFFFTYNWNFKEEQSAVIF